MKKYAFLVILLSVFVGFSQAPTRNQYGFVTSASNDMAASAIMEARSTTKGLLIPRMTEAQRDAIVSPATGLLIYNTDTNIFDYFNGSIWSSIDLSTIGLQQVLTNGDTATDLGMTLISTDGTGQSFFAGGSLYIRSEDYATTGAYIGIETDGSDNAVISFYKGGFQSRLVFADPLTGGDISFPDPEGNKTVAYVEDLPAFSGVESVTGTNVDNTDPQNPIIETPTLSQVTGEGNTTGTNIVVTSGSSSTTVAPADILAINSGTSQYTGLLSTSLVLSTNTGSKGLLVKNDNMATSYTVQAPNLSPTGTYYWPMSSVELSASEVDALDGVTSGIQGQINTKAKAPSGMFPSAAFNYAITATTLTKAFNVGASGNGAFNAQTKLYYFDGYISLSGLSSSSGSVSFGFLGTATISGIRYTTSATKAALPSGGLAANVTTVAATALTTATTQTTAIMRVTGQLRVSSAGTIIPAVTGSVNSPSANTDANSWFIFEEIGGNTMTATSDID